MGTVRVTLLPVVMVVVAPGAGNMKNFTITVQQDAEDTLYIVHKWGLSSGLQSAVR